MQILKNIWNDFSNQIKFSKLFKDERMKGNILWKILWKINRLYIVIIIHNVHVTKNHVHIIEIKLITYKLF